MGEQPHRFGRLAEDLIGSLRRLPSDDPSRSRWRPSVEIAALIDTLRAQHGIGIVTTEQAIRDNWSEIVGPANASYSHAVRLDERGRLEVRASHAVVRNELFMHRLEILARIQALPGCGAVKQLRLSQG